MRVDDESLRNYLRAEIERRGGITQVGDEAEAHERMVVGRHPSPESDEGPGP